MLDMYVFYTLAINADLDEKWYRLARKIIDQQNAHVSLC